MLAQGIPTLRRGFVQFFVGQRKRVTDRLAEYGPSSKRARGGRLKSLPMWTKDALTPDALWDASEEDAALKETYLPLVDQVGGLTLANQPGLGDAGVTWDTSNPKIAEARDRLAEKVTRVNDTTRAQLAEAVDTGLKRGYSVVQIANGVGAENYDGVLGVFDTAVHERAETIARTETALAYNAASLAGYDELDVEMVEVMDGEGDEACAEANGQVWTLPEAEGNELEHPNCVRSFAPVVGQPGPGEVLADLGEGDESLAGEIADRLNAWNRRAEDLGGRVKTDVPPREKLVENWTKQLDGHRSTDAHAHELLRRAIVRNQTNPLMREVVDANVPDYVVLTREVKPTGSLFDEPPTEIAHRVGLGTTDIRDVNVRKNGVRVAQAPRRGEASIGARDLAAVLRHEYGHSLQDVLAPADAKAIREMIPDARGELSLYAGAKDTEVVPELFAMVTDPLYDPRAFSRNVQRAAKRLLERIGVKNPKTVSGGELVPLPDAEQIWAGTQVRLYPEQLGALERFTSNSWGFHRLLRGSEADARVAQGPPLPPGEREQLSRDTVRLDRAIEGSKATEAETLLYRGAPHDIYSDLKVGEVYTDTGFASTSTSESMARSFEHHLLEIRMPKGSRGLWVGDRGFTGNASEREVILPRGMRYRVIEQDNTPSGLGKGRVLGRTVLEVIPEPSRKEVADTWQRAFVMFDDGKQFDAVVDYTASGYDEINGLLRGREYGEVHTQRLWDQINSLDRVIERQRPTDATTILWRGTGRHGYKEKQPGERITEPTFLSTSTNPEMAAGFLRNNESVLKIEVPPGVKGFDVKAWELAQGAGGPGENEVILPRGMRFEVLRQEHGITRVRVIPPERPRMTKAEAEKLAHGGFHTPLDQVGPEIRGPLSEGAIRLTRDLFKQDGYFTGGYDGSLAIEGGRQLVEVNPADLAPVENKVDMGALERALMRPDEYPITGVRLPDGTVMVDGGTPGAAAAVLRGDETVRVKIGELSEVRQVGSDGRKWPSARDEWDRWNAMKGFAEVHPEDFMRAIKPVLDTDLGKFLTAYSPLDYASMKTYLTGDGKAGAALKPGGVRTDGTPALEMVSLFRAPDGPKGIGMEVARKQAELGGNRLDALGEHLRGEYEKLGFKVVGRKRWDEAYAPPGWNYERYGRPNVYVMEKDPVGPAPFKSKPTAKEKLAGKTFDQLERAEGGMGRLSHPGNAVRINASLNPRFADAAARERVRELFPRTWSYEDAIGRIDGLIAKAPAWDRGLLYRGMSPANTSVEVAGRPIADVSKLKVGDTFVDDGYIAAKSDPAPALFEAGGGKTPVLEIEIPDDALTVLDMSNVNEQRQFAGLDFLLGRGQRIEITGAPVTREGTTVIPARLVPQATPPIPEAAKPLTGDLGELRDSIRKQLAGKDPNTMDPQAAVDIGGQIRHYAEGQQQALGVRLAEARRAVIEASKAERQAYRAYSEANARVPTGNPPEKPKLVAERDAAHARWYEAIDAEGKARGVRHAAKAAYTEARTKALKDALDAIRPTGMGGNFSLGGVRNETKLSDRTPLRRLHEGAEPYFPRDWIDHSNRNGKLKLKVVPGRARGHFHPSTGAFDAGKGYRVGGGEIVLSRTTWKNKPTTVLHEATHRMEDVVPNLKRLEQAYWEERAERDAQFLETGELQKLKKLTGNSGYDADEMALKDKWSHPYTGKVYDQEPLGFDERGAYYAQGPGPNGEIDPPPELGYAGELITMAQQGVWYGDHRMWEKDPETVNFMLGLLAAL